MSEDDTHLRRPLVEVKRTLTKSSRIRNGPKMCLGVPEGSVALRAATWIQNISGLSQGPGVLGRLLLRPYPPTATAMGRPMLDVRRREFITLLGGTAAINGLVISEAFVPRRSCSSRVWPIS